MNMASNGESFNKKVVRLVEMINFDIKIVSIRGRMQKLEPAQRDPPGSKIWRPEPDTYVGVSHEMRE